jgi:hypothetical protein
MAIATGSRGQVFTGLVSADLPGVHAGRFSELVLGHREVRPAAPHHLADVHDPFSPERRLHRPTVQEAGVGVPTASGPPSRSYEWA